jgi:hypothetical protein
MQTTNLLLFHQHYVIFVYIILTKTCNIVHYWYHNIESSLWPVLFAYVLNKFCSKLSEDGEIVIPKHIGAM